MHTCTAQTVPSRLAGHAAEHVSRVGRVAARDVCTQRRRHGSRQEKKKEANKQSLDSANQGLAELRSEDWTDGDRVQRIKACSRDAPQGTACGIAVGKVKETK